MPTLLLIRHGRTSANATGILAGWLPGVELDERGVQQAERLADRLADLPVCRVVASPLTRTLQTAAPLASRWSLPVDEDPGIGECRYGAWTGRPLKELAGEELWRTVQRAPSSATFPPSDDFEHESIAEMAARGIATVRRIDREVAAEHGEHAIWMAISHADVVKAIVADALGMHLDAFQRIVIDPASVSVIRYVAGGRPLVLGVNGPGVDLHGLLPPEQPTATDQPADPHTSDTAKTAADDGIIGGGPG